MKTPCSSSLLLHPGYTRHAHQHDCKSSLMMVALIASGLLLFYAVAQPMTWREQGGLVLSLLSIPSVGVSNIKQGTSLRIYKRTHASVHAKADAAFVSKYLGMSLVLNKTYTCDESGGYTCANREILTGIDDWDMHYFQSFVTPIGNITVQDWVTLWYDLHGNYGSDWEWDEFMPQGVSFYAPSLTSFVEMWRDDGISHLLRKYDDVSGRTIYSARVTVPNTGHVIEVVSGLVGSHLEDWFKLYSAIECGECNRIRYPLSTMESGWKAFMESRRKQRRLSRSSLPEILIVQISQPSENVNELPNFISRFSGYDLDTNGYALYSNGEAEWTDLWIQFGPFEHNFEASVEWNVNLRLVRNPLAKSSGRLSVAFYEKYIAEVSDSLIGCDKGYVRYLDWHIGLMMVNGTTEDANSAALCNANVGFHNGGDHGTGSSWTRGASGLGVEFHGYYDYTYYNESKIKNLDYCSPSGFDDVVGYCNDD